MYYGFQITHRADVEHQAADSLSRLKTEGTDDSYVEDDIPVIAVTTLAQSRRDKLVDNHSEKDSKQDKGVDGSQTLRIS